MQATFPLGRSSIQGFVIALGVAAVLILGMLGGYWIKGLAPAATRVVTVTRVQPASPTGSSQGLFGSNNPLATSRGAAAAALNGPQNQNLETIGSSGAPARANYAHPHAHGFTE
jgi:hypothetical protein